MPHNILLYCQRSSQLDSGERMFCWLFRQMCQLDIHLHSSRSNYQRSNLLNSDKHIGLSCCPWIAIENSSPRIGKWKYLQRLSKYQTDKPSRNSESHFRKSRKSMSPLDRCLRRDGLLRRLDEWNWTNYRPRNRPQRNSKLCSERTCPLDRRLSKFVWGKLSDNLGRCYL